MITFNYDSVNTDVLMVAFAQRALSSVQGVQHTYLITQHVLKARIPGDLVECGVAYGGCAAAMMQAAKDLKMRRGIHLFDSFEGIPMAGPKDADQPGIGDFVVSQSLPLEERLVSSGISSCSEGQLVDHFHQWGLDDYPYHLYKGWFQHTLPSNTLGPISLLRLDGDLYESTECCLKWLYEKVSPGGVVLVDDWPLPGSRQAVIDYFEKVSQPLPEVHVTVDTGACYWIKP